MVKHDSFGYGKIIENPMNSARERYTTLTISLRKTVQTFQGQFHRTERERCWFIHWNELGNSTDRDGGRSQEIQRMGKRRRKGEIPDYSTTSAIQSACNALGIDYRNTKYSIEWYARRCDKFHSKVSLAIQETNWPLSATRLGEDPKDLPHCFGEKEYQNMRRVLEAVRDRYFAELGRYLE